MSTEKPQPVNTKPKKHYAMIFLSGETARLLEEIISSAQTHLAAAGRGDLACNVRQKLTLKKIHALRAAFESQIFEQYPEHGWEFGLDP